MDLRQRFTGAGDIRKIKLGVPRPGNTGYCFMRVVFDVPSGNGDVEFDVVAFENNFKRQWEDIEQLTEGVCVYIEGYFQTRKQTDDRFKNDSGMPFVSRYPQLVVEKIEVL
jgi:hypothetical protein